MIVIEYINKSFSIEIEKSQSLYDKGFGEKYEKVVYFDVYEILYLLERKKIKVVQNKVNNSIGTFFNFFKKKKKNDKSKELSFNGILKETNTSFKNYLIYKDLKSRGYEVKTGLKYGFTFRIYDKGIKRGEDHSLWLVEPIDENDVYKMKDFTGKNRVAHTTKKKMLFAIIDNENDITYLEIQWKRM